VSVSKSVNVRKIGQRVSLWYDRKC